MLMPERFRRKHLEHRAGFVGDHHARAMGADLEIYALHKDGREIPVEISLSPMKTDGGMLITSAIRDVSQRKEAEENLRSLTGRLLQMQDEERRRIARELHDSAGQILAALNMNLAPLQSEDGKIPLRIHKVIRDSVGLLNELSQQLRTISHLLHPPLLDEVGLPSAIRSYLDGFTKRSKIKVSFESDNDFGRLSQDLETAIFRIVQECLTNIHRHSGSQVAKVRLTRRDTQVRLDVADEGKGIPAGKLKSYGKDAGKLGVGVRGMRERVRQLGGTLDITSGRQGTVIVARLPVVAVSSTAVA